MTKKITLVIPNYREACEYLLLSKRPLLGVGYIAAVLMQKGCGVNVIDAFAENLTPEQVIKRIQNSGSEITGISLNVLAYEFAKELAGLCRRYGIKVIVGGPEVTISPGTAVKEIRPDVAVIGEGEQTILELLGILESEGRWSPKFLASVKGIAFFDIDGQLIRTDTRQRMTDLDNLPFMPYEIFPLNSYNLSYSTLPKTPVFGVYTSRGCPYNCSFCSNREVWQRKCFYMSAERVLDEIEHIIANYPVKGINFHDDSFSLNEKRVIDICEGMLRRGIKIPWACQGRAEGLDEETLRLMKRAGCKSMSFGIESGSKRILSLINKEIEPEQALATIRLAKKAGIAVIASIMVGLPTQTRAEENQTIQFLKKAKCTIVYMAPYLGYPGSDIYKQFLSNDSKYVYKRIGTLVLPNSEELSWPQKVAFMKRYNRKFNLTFRHLLYLIANFGMIATAKICLNKILRRKQ